MNRFCKGRAGGKCSGSLFGLALMVIGAILLFCSLPSWLWLSALAILLISAGFLLWRF